MDILLHALLIGLTTAALCFVILTLFELSFPLCLSCAAALGCAIFFLTFSIVKLAACPKRKEETPPAAFAPPPVVTLKSKSPEQLEYDQQEQLIRELEEKQAELERQITALRKRGKK